MAETTAFKLRNLVEQALDPLVAKATRCALVDFPSSANVGDNAIWIGETTYLRSRGLKPVYQCDRETYSELILRKRLGDGVIFLHGGGNLGDVWEGSQGLREEVISAFRENQIVIMPQTIHFRDRANLMRAKKIFDRHDDLTIVTRSRKSFEIASGEFRARVLLAPDMAFCMGGIQRSTTPSTAVLWLARTDQEANGYDIPAAAELKQVDWVEVGRLREAAVSMSRNSHFRASAEAMKDAIRYVMRTSSPAIGKTFDRRARQRLHRGIALLSQGRVVITDRLHGHVLSLMMGIPHVLLDNNYGKLRDFYETWTTGGDLVHWATSPEEALRIGLGLDRN